MLMLVNGDYVPQKRIAVSEGDRQFYSAMLINDCPAGAVSLYGEFLACGLWTLDRLRPAERQAAAEQYVLEALKMSQA